MVLASACQAAPAAGASLAPAAAASAAATPAAAEGQLALPARKGLQDPMERLRERLAEKLAGGRKVDAASPGLVRVVSRSSGATGGSAAAPLVAASTPPVVQRKRSGTGAQRPAEPPHWDYQGPGGPEHWGQLKPEFATCAVGKRQSPIDIRDGIKVQIDPVQFDYRASGFRVVDNGHTVQVDVGTGNAISVLGRRYELQHFHFHRPSEERIAGRQFAMVAHLVHQADDGRLAVVAVLLEQGRAHPIVQAVWNNLPLDRGEDVAARTNLDLAALLPEDRSYFTYMGSLTTPPCSEGVLWMVMRQPVSVSPEQIDIFARLYPMNARPIQQASGRLIKESD
jgi:carbonic anhydrase